MVVVAGDVAGVLVGDLALLAVGVPDTGPAAVFARRAFDLKARGRYAPDEIAPQRSDRRELGLRDWPAPADVLAPSSTGIDDPLLTSSYKIDPRRSALLRHVNTLRCILGNLSAVKISSWPMPTQVPKTRWGGIADGISGQADIFRVDQSGGVFWLIDPDGGRLLSKGVNTVRFDQDQIRNSDRIPYAEACRKKYGSHRRLARSGRRPARGLGLQHARLLVRRSGGERRRLHRWR